MRSNILCRIISAVLLLLILVDAPATLAQSIDESQCDGSKTAKNLVLIIDGKSRKDDVAQAVQASAGPGILTGLSCLPVIVGGDWVTTSISGLKPAALIVHLHTFRSKKINNALAEKKLIEGLGAFHHDSSATKIIIFSASFKKGQSSDSRLEEATKSLSPDANDADYRDLLSSIKLVAWPIGAGPDSTAAMDLRALIKMDLAAIISKKVDPGDASTIATRQYPINPDPDAQRHERERADRRDRDQSLASWIFGGLCLVYLIFMSTFLIVRRDGTNDIPPIPKAIIGFLCAIAGGFCAFFFTGALGLGFTIPMTKISGNAVGGLAVFVFVLLMWKSLTTPPAPDPVDKVIEATDRLFRDMEDVWIGVTVMADNYRPNPSIVHDLGQSQDGRFLTFFRKNAGHRETLQTLTMTDVRSRLSPDEMKNLVENEKDMRARIAAWTREKAKIPDISSASMDEKSRLYKIAADMADDLTTARTLITRSLGGELQDHYGTEMGIADRARGLLASLERERQFPVEREFGD